MNQLLEEKYKELGISEKVYAFGEKIEQELKERFEKIDANAEYNQMKVIAARFQLSCNVMTACTTPGHTGCKLLPVYYLFVFYPYPLSFVNCFVSFFTTLHKIFVSLSII